MHYVCLLRSRKLRKFYIGETSDLKRRFYEHNNGNSRSTKSDLPWDLVYYEAYASKQAALNREKKLKQYGQSLTRLKRRIGLDDA